MKTPCFAVLGDVNPGKSAVVAALAQPRVPLRVTRLQIIQQQKSRFHAGFQIVATHDLRHVAHDVVH